MIIGNTEHNMYVYCRWQWDAMSFSRQGLTPIVTKPYLDLGSLVHKADYDWIMNPDGHPADFFMAHATQHIVKMNEAYKEAIGAGLSPSELAVLDEVVRVGRGMMENYHAKYSAPLPPGWRLVSAEQTILVPIPDTRHNPVCANGAVFDTEGWAQTVCECTRCGHKDALSCDALDCVCCCWHEFEGTVDALLQDENGRLWIKETKTFDRHPNIEELPRTPQFAKYKWGVEQLGTQVMGVAYNGLWSRAVVPSRSKFDDLFIREKLVISESLVEKVGQELAMCANEIAAGPSIYKNRNFMCRSCGVYELCVADDFAEDYEFVLQQKYRKRPHTITGALQASA